MLLSLMCLTMMPGLWAANVAPVASEPQKAITQQPAAEDQSPAWKVYEQPSLEAPAHEIRPKHWRLESGDWYRFTDQEHNKTYWVHKDSLKDKNIYLSTMTEQRSESGNASMKTWERFDQQFEEMMDLQGRYMQEMRQKASEFFKTSYVMRGGPMSHFGSARRMPCAWVLKRQGVVGSRLELRSASHMLRS